jgi:hypothetical protein
MTGWLRALASWWRVRRIRRRLEGLGYVPSHRTSRHDWK